VTDQRTVLAAGSRFVYQCALRWSDLDAYGHVNNARFLTLYEEARVAMMFTAARAAGVTSFEEGVVIARHEIDYLRPVDYRPAAGPDERPRVRIELWVEQIRPSRFVIGYELFDGAQLAGRARSVVVPFDLPKGRPRRLSDAEDAYLRPYLAASECAGSLDASRPRPGTFGPDGRSW
jgi:acyl-CoA thioester hydrolase